jgi:hypothetical protein
MVIYIKDNIKKIERKEKENILGLIDVVMRDSL